MPGIQCKVCNNKMSKTRLLTDKPTIMYHSFPSNLEVQNLWVRACKLGSTINPTTSRVCSEHFATEDYKQTKPLKVPCKTKILKKTAVPHLKLPAKERDESVTESLEQSKMAELMEVKKEPIDEDDTSEQAQVDTDEIVKTIVDVHVPITHVKEVENLLTTNETMIKELVEVKNVLKVTQVALYETRRQLSESQNKVSELQKKLSQISSASGIRIAEQMLGKVFTNTQSQIIMFGKSRAFWNEEDMDMAFKLRDLGVQTYNYLRDKMGVPLPSVATLRRWAAQHQLKLDILKSAAPPKTSARTAKE